jgi:hypothetical protein
MNVLAVAPERVGAAGALTPAAAADAHLAGLAARLTAAADSAALPAGETRIAWEILLELTEATHARLRLEQDIREAVTVVQACVADADSKARDPLEHARRYLTRRGKMPPPETSSLVILAWDGPPPVPARRRRLRLQPAADGVPS